MKAFRAIVGLTFRNAMRSHIFQLLLAVLLLCVVVIPVSVSVGKAEEFIRVSLLYSLWAVSIVLSLSSLWLGCFVMSRDIDNYQMHMIASKPVSRITVWLGKWVGINLVNIILLFAASAAVYGIVMYRYHTAADRSRYAERAGERKLLEAEKERIRTKVLVGRRGYLPERPDVEKRADEIVQSMVAAAVKSGKRPSDEEIAAMRLDVKKRLQAPVEVLPGRPREWRFRSVPLSLNGSDIYLRYRPYIKKVSSEDQRNTHLLWGFLEPRKNPDTGAVSVYPRLLTPQPEQVFTGVFHEKILPKGSVAPDGTVTIFVSNLDRYGDKHYYQQADGPKLLVPVCGFEENFLRGLLVMTIQLLLLSGIACAFGGFLTMPTAVFMVVSYLLFGSFSMILTDSEFFVGSGFDRLGQVVAGWLLKVVIPLQRFDITDMLAGGELIEYGFIGQLFLRYFILRGVPLFLLGIWLYRRRELGAAVRK